MASESPDGASGGLFRSTSFGRHLVEDEVAFVDVGEDGVLERDRAASGLARQVDHDIIAALRGPSIVSTLTVLPVFSSAIVLTPDSPHRPTALGLGTTIEKILCLRGVGQNIHTID